MAEPSAGGMDWASSLRTLSQRFLQKAAAAVAQAERLPDPYLQSVRRRTAAGNIPASVSSLLIVCYGNICRSPYAAAVLSRRLANRGLAITSAGFHRSGRPSPPEAVAVARERGVEMAAHRSATLSRELVESADLIIAMELRHQRTLRSEFGTDVRRTILLGDFDPGRVTDRDISDPYGSSSEVFHNCFARIERCAEALAEAIERSSTASDQEPRR